MKNVKKKDIFPKNHSSYKILCAEFLFCTKNKYTEELSLYPS